MDKIGYDFGIKKNKGSRVENDWKKSPFDNKTSFYDESISKNTDGDNNQSHQLTRYYSKK